MTLRGFLAGTADFLNTYSYNTLSQLSMIDQQGQSGGNAVAPKSIYLGYDAIGDVNVIYRQNSVTIGPPMQYDPADTAIGYDPTTGLLSSIVQTHGNATLENLSYTYDPVARVKTFTSNDGTATYGYDPTSQLTSATYTTAPGGTQPPNESFGFDPNGNRTSVNSVTTTVGANNQVSNDGTFTYTFDPEGNRLTRTRDSSGAANDYLVKYSWDYRDRLTEVQNFNNSGTLTEQLNYSYDVWDHLVQRVDQVIGGTTTTLDYVWDASAPPSAGVGGQPPSAPGNIVAAFNGSQQLVARYLNGPNLSASDQFFSTLAEEHVNSVTSPGSVTYDLLDMEGTLRDIVDANGVLQNHIVYSAFGQDYSESNPSISHLGGYAGGLYDPSTQLLYLIHRWYDPKAMVWISADPTGFRAGDVNPTRYVGNRPTNASDPSGEYEIEWEGTWPPKQQKLVTDMLAKVRKDAATRIKEIDALLKAQSACVRKELKPVFDQLKKVFKSVIDGIDSKEENLEIYQSDFSTGTHKDAYAYSYRSTVSSDAELHLNSDPKSPNLNWVTADPTTLEQKIFHELTHIDADTLDNDDKGEAMNAGWIERIITGGINNNNWIDNLIRRAKRKCGELKEEC